MQRHILISNLLRKQNYVFVFRIKKNAVPFESLEIPRRSERGRCSVPGDGDVGKIKTVVNAADARVFDAKLFIFISGEKSRTVARINRSPIAAADDSQMRNEGQSNQTIAFSVYHADIDRGELVIGFPIDGNPLRVRFPAGKAGVARTLFRGLLGDTHK